MSCLLILQSEPAHFWYTNGKVLAKEDSIVLALSCPMIFNIHLWKTAETYCPTVAYLEEGRVRASKRMYVYWEGRVLILLAWDTLCCVFKELYKSPKYTYLYAVYFLKSLLTVNWPRLQSAWNIAGKKNHSAFALQCWFPTSFKAARWLPSKAAWDVTHENGAKCGLAGKDSLDFCFLCITLEKADRFFLKQRLLARDQ